MWHLVMPVLAPSSSVKRNVEQRLESVVLMCADQSWLFDTLLAYITGLNDQAHAQFGKQQCQF